VPRFDLSHEFNCAHRFPRIGTRIATTQKMAKRVPISRESKVIELWPKEERSCGLHLLGEWYGCGAQRALLEDPTHLNQLCRVAAEGAGLHVVSDHFHRCKPAGVTGTLLLDESHLVIHTHPLDQSVTLDVFVSGHTPNNRVKARAVYSFLKEGLQPEKENYVQINRGGIVDTPPEHH